MQFVIKTGQTFKLNWRTSKAFGDHTRFSLATFCILILGRFYSCFAVKQRLVDKLVEVGFCFLQYKIRWNASFSL